MKKTVAIIGSGKIGRGYLADLFSAAGYHITFIDISTDLVDKLNSRGQYTLFITGKAETKKRIIKDYEAYSIERDFTTIIEKLSIVDMVCVALYPNALPSVANQIVETIKRCIEISRKNPLNFIFFVNKALTARRVKEMVEKQLHTETEINYYKDNIGIVEALTLRGGVNPTPKMLKEDPLCVSSSEGTVIPVGDEFVGPKPDMEFIQFTDRVEGRLAEKVWCGNMLHCTIASIGWNKGYKYTVECANDPYIQNIADQAYNEASFGIGKEFNFNTEEIKEGKNKYWNFFMKSNVLDDVEHVSADPLRKLSRDDRYIGPALLCLKYNKLPYFLARGAAYLFLFENEKDPSALKLQSSVKSNGIEQTIWDVCDLSPNIKEEQMLHQLILAHYKEIAFRK